MLKTKFIFPKSKIWVQDSDIKFELSFLTSNLSSFLGTEKSKVQERVLKIKSLHKGSNWVQTNFEKLRADLI